MPIKHKQVNDAMILFISDLHLSPDRPKITQAFYQFLDTTAKGAKTLYILGDFFDTWIGDDDDTPEFQNVIEALNTYQQQGSQLYFMRGNRDFLVGEAFAASIGATLLTDPHPITLNQQQVLLMHGDSLCTKDSEYMHFRQMVRNPKWQSAILSKPLAERKHIAAALRTKSQSMNSLKAEDIMDVTPDEVINVMSKYRSTLLIHGHTHRPNRHPVMIGEQHGERIVLGDWHRRAWYLCFQEKPQGQFELRHFDID